MSHTHSNPSELTVGCPACIAAVRRPPRTDDGLSAGARLTKNNNDLLASGVHPATRLPLADNGETCGTCAHHRSYLHHNGSYHKCVLHRLGTSHSANSDIRVKWQACVKWEPES